VFINLLERPRTAELKVIVLHLFLLIKPEYAIVPGRYTSSAGRETTEDEGFRAHLHSVRALLVRFGDERSLSIVG
jgi:hypothetical protein